MSRLVEEDPSLRAGRDPQTGEFLLSGAGQLHVEIAVSKLKNRSKVEVILHPPKVPYREAIRRTAVGHGRHKKQSGGRGQFADCTITMEPVATPEDYEFVDEIFGGSIPQNYRPAVEKGLLEAAGRGYLAGYPGRQLPRPPAGRQVPRRRLVGDGVQGRRFARLQGRDGQGRADPCSNP